MSNVLINEDSMKTIADAIREKGGTSDLLKPKEMPEAIMEISTWSGEGADPSKPVRFYGAYGELLYSYTIEEAQTMTELPVLPSYKGLIGQSWNWSLESVNAITNEAEIGALVITDDGSTRIYIELIEEALNPKIGFNQETANSVWIDWGDGSELETSEVCGEDTKVSIEHQYAEPGNYVIRLIPEEGVNLVLIGDANSTKILHRIMDYAEGNFVYGNAIKKIELGACITTLGGRCLNCTSLESITMTENITEVNNAFQGCDSLKTIILPQGVTSLTSYALRNCRSLEKIVFSDGSLKMVGSSCAGNISLQQLILPPRIILSYSDIFSGCTGLRRVVFNDAITSIGGDLFYQCVLLKDVTLSKNIKSITAGMFEYCESLEFVEIPDGVTTILSSAFYCCRSLRKIELPKTVTTINSSAFSGCYSLAKITIPEYVTTISSAAFYDCKGMTDYYLLPTIPPTLSNTNIFYNIPSDCKIHVPVGCLEAYQTAEHWSTWASQMVEMEE